MNYILEILQTNQIYTYMYLFIINIVFGNTSQNWNFLKRVLLAN